MDVNTLIETLKDVPLDTIVVLQGGLCPKLAPRPIGADEDTVYLEADFDVRDLTVAEFVDMIYPYRWIDVVSYDNADCGNRGIQEPVISMKNPGTVILIVTGRQVDGY